MSTRLSSGAGASAEEFEQRGRAVARLLSPSTVAVVGATEHKTRFGGAALSNILQFGFSGSIYPVNPGRSHVQGIRCYKSIADVPEHVDVAVLAIPADAVIEQLRQLADCGVDSAIVYASALSASQVDTIRSIVDSTGLHVLGPNTSGLSNLRAGFVPRGARSHGSELEAGDVAVIAQSGGLSATMANLLASHGAGVAYAVSVGAQTDLDLWDFVGHAATDPDVRTILLAVEGILTPDRMLRALDQARRTSTMVGAIRIGRTATGADAVATHTGTLAGSGPLSIDVLRSYGVVVEDGIEELCALAGVRATLPREVTRIRRLGVVTTSGAAGAIIADTADDVGLDLPSLSPETRDWLRNAAPLVSPENPVDTGGGIVTNHGLIGGAIQAFRRQQDIDVVLFSTTAFHDEYDFVYRSAAEGLDADLSVPAMAAAWHVPGMNDQGIHLLRARGGLIPSDRIAVKVLAEYGRWLQHDERHDNVQLRLARPRNTAGTIEPYWTSRQLLGSTGINFPDAILATTVDEAVEAAADLGWPVAMKLSSGQINHKAISGAVVLDVAEVDVAAKAARRLLALEDGDAGSGLVVERQIAAPVEFLLGGISDATFGPAVAFGIGGSMAEAVDHVRSLPGPLDITAARWLIDHSKAGDIPLLDRAIDDVSQLISTFSQWFAVNDDIVSVDVNPLVLSLDGQLRALDARIVRRTSRQATHQGALK